MSVLISVVFLVLKQIGWTPSIALLMKHAALPLQIPFFFNEGFAKLPTHQGSGYGNCNKAFNYFFNFTLKMIET